MSSLNRLRTRIWSAGRWRVLCDRNRNLAHFRRPTGNRRRTILRGRRSLRHSTCWRRSASDRAGDTANGRPAGHRRLLHSRSIQGSDAWRSSIRNASGNDTRSLERACDTRASGTSIRRCYRGWRFVQRWANASRCWSRAVNRAHSTRATNSTGCGVVRRARRGCGALHRAHISCR